jgi:hypothetical protein
MIIASYARRNCPLWWRVCGERPSLTVTAVIEIVLDRELRILNYRHYIWSTPIIVVLKAVHAIISSRPLIKL